MRRYPMAARTGPDSCGATEHPGRCRARNTEDANRPYTPLEEEVPMTTPAAATLKDKTLFITGASRGIGLAIALRAARDGANIAIAAKTAEPHARLEGTIYTAAEAIE